MRQVREVLRLRTAGVGLNEIARRVGVAPSTVRLTLKRLASAGLSWPLPAEMTDSALETALFAAAGTKQGHRRHAEPDWAEIHRELKRKHVTLTMLWDEYIERCPEGYRYSRFCELYRGWASRLSVTMRQAHIGGDKLFVDYAGDTVPVIVDRLTGQVRPAQIFVAVMGASNFTYAEASWTQALADWIGAHTRAFAALGGVPKLLVPDNTKVAVIKACLYEPQVNRTYAEMAAHYDTAILPARPRRPRDKAKVEVAVLIIERWLLGRLRHRRFYSLAELNTAIGELLRQLNDERPIRRLGVTRRALFEELDRPNLNSLPAQPYCFAEWRVRRVGVDYHVELEGHFYSVPYQARLRRLAAGVAGLAGLLISLFGLRRAPARAAKLHPVRPGSALSQPASKTQWRLRDQSAVAPGDCRSCSAARRSASSGNSHEIVAALRGTRATTLANSRCLASRRERKRKNLRHQNSLKKQPQNRSAATPPH